MGRRARHRVRAAVARVVDREHRVPDRQVLRVGEPAAVRAPGVIGDIVLRAPIHLPRLAPGGGSDPQRLRLVRPRNPLPVGREDRRVVPAARGGGHDDDRLAATPGVDDPDLLLAGRVAHVDQLLAIGRERSPALARATAARHGQRHALLHRNREDLAARDDRETLALGREVERRDRALRVRVARARQELLAGQIDVELALLPRGGIVQVEVGGQREHDAAVRPAGWPARVPRVKARVLLPICAIGAHRPHILGAAAVVQEVDAVAVPHRECVARGRGRRDARELGAGRIADPDVRRGAAAVALPRAELAL